MHRIRSLRFRIAFAYIAGALLVAGFVAAGTLYITSEVLTRQSINDARTRSLAQVELVRDRIKLEERGVRELRGLRELAEILQAGAVDALVKAGDLPADSTSMSISEDTIPGPLREVVEEGGVGYVIFEGPGHRRIAFGTHVPGVTVGDPLTGEPVAVVTYFVYSLERDDRTLGLLRLVLLVVVAAATGVAGAVGLRLADRTIRPLRAAATAAHQIAEGSLETRLEETGEDELARLARSFNEMTGALSDRMARERRFIGDVSHELRSPLTALKTSIDYMAERADDLPSRIRPAVGLAVEEVRSLQRLVDDLLELSRAEAGGIEIVSEEVDLVNFANELVRRRVPESLVSIDGPERLVVNTDKMRLERVVGNLLENAVFHGEGREVRILLDAVDDHARIVVADSGPGIDPEQLVSIFDRFFRGDASRQRDGRVGAGLGLAIARENAGLVGAELKVDSEKGLGTRFEVLLPVGAEI